MNAPSFRFLRVEEVTHLTGLKRSHIYHLELDGKFPRRIKLSHRAVVWRSDQVHAWLLDVATRQALRRAPAGDSVVVQVDGTPRAALRERDARIRREFTGTNRDELCRAYGISRITLWRILRAGVANAH
jgi:prophage regulatory protein